jgi:hypothetical protein
MFKYRMRPPGRAVKGKMNVFKSKDIYAGIGIPSKKPALTTAP